MYRPVSKVSITPHFERSFTKLPRHLQDITVVKDKIFRANAFDPRLRTHALKGKLEGLWSYSVDKGYRILFEFAGSSEVIYHDIGSHNIYRR